MFRVPGSTFFFIYEEMQSPLRSLFFSGARSCRTRKLWVALGCRTNWAPAASLRCYGAPNTTQRMWGCGSRSVRAAQGLFPDLL